MRPRQSYVAYYLGVTYRNQGLMANVIRIVVGLAIEHLKDIRAHTTLFLRNQAGWRVLEKNGGTVNRTRRQHVFKKRE